MDTAQKVPPTLDTAKKSTGFSFCVRSLFFVLSGSSASFSVELCGRVDRETPPYLPTNLLPHLPTPSSAWSSRTMSGLEGNPSATSSAVAGSATGSSVEVCRLFGHRNYRPSFEFTFTLPPKNEKPLTAKNLPPYCITAKQVPPYCITAEKMPPYFGLPLPPKLSTHKNEKTAYRQKITAVLHYR